MKRDRRSRCTELKRGGEVGLFVGRISRVATFDGYVDARATESKILRDVFSKGDAWFNTGDLLKLHENGLVSLPTASATPSGGRARTSRPPRSLLRSVRRPGSRKRTCTAWSFPARKGELAWRASVSRRRSSSRRSPSTRAAKLPKYARPIFIRLQQDMRVTGTLKHQKADYRSEGYDPTRTQDPLYALVGSEYVTITAGALFAQIQAGSIRPG